MPNFGKIKLDFHVFDTGDPDRLLVADFSQWKVIKNLPASMDITVPGYEESITLPFKKESFNNYTSLSLGLSKPVECEDNITMLPDGIYEFCLRGGAYGKRQKHRYFLKTDIITTNLRKAWINLGLKYDPNTKSNIESLLYVKGYLESAKANAEDGNVKESIDLYHMSNDKLSTFLDCKGCL